ncbi:MAG: PAS domain-containing protein [Candidatus Zapsychrus exili]|nr:PAS domain-containing protein [Candidatus Zapsychrus exili]
MNEQDVGKEHFRDKFKDLFDNMSDGVAIYEAVDDGNDFIFRNINRAGERISKVSKDEIINKSVLKVFPNIVEFGLFDVFKKVYRTGDPALHPASLYKDNRVVHWTENYVFKLKTGEIVAVYNDVTDLKKAEEEIKGLSKFPSENSNPVLRINNDKTVLYANLVAEDILSKENIKTGSGLYCAHS